MNDDIKTKLTLLTDFAARQARLHAEGKPLEGNVTDKENEFLILLTTATQQAVIEELRKIRQWNGTIFHDDIMDYCGDRLAALKAQLKLKEG
jgi:hypothetical protein